MKANKICRSLFSLLLVLAVLVSCVGAAFATNEAETTAAVTVEETATPTTKAAVKASSSDVIVADWVHDYTIADRGAENLMADYAKLGITDVYLLVKGTAGKLGWTSSVANTVQASNGDILGPACEAAEKYGIRVHAWLMAGHDDHYINNIDSSAMAYHFRVGYGSSVNQRLNLRDQGYRDYTAKLVKELVTKYNIAGIHLDCIRYFELYYDWGQNARDELLTNYGITIDQYNAATKAMCKRGGYSYTMKTGSTAGYNNGASYSYVAYSASGTSASSNTTFATVLTSSSYGDAYKGAQAFMELRTDTVAGFVETVKKAAGDDKIISCAIMPEPIENTFSKCLYGQDPAKLGEVCDYITPMAYATQYQQTSSWPASLSEKCAAVGANVVTGIQAFNETYVSYASDLNAEIPQVLAKAETVNAKTNYGDILGYAFFRGGAMTIANSKHNESDSTLDIYVSNQTTTSDTKLVFKLQNGMTVNTSALTNGFSDKSGFKSGASFTVSSDKKTITISNSGSAVLGGTSSASFKVAVSGTPSTTYGAVQLTSYYGSSYSEGKSFCVASAVDAGTYDGIVKGTCSGAHTSIETWTDGNGKHFAFCYNCLTDLTESCIVTHKETDGYVSYACAGGLNPTTGLTDTDAYSADGGCGYSYVASDSLSLHFNVGDIADDTSDWTATANGTMTGEVDTDYGILAGQITGGDPYIVASLKDDEMHYNIEAGDIIELRMKTTTADTTLKGVQVFFTTALQTSFNETYSCANHQLQHATGAYEIIQLPFDASKEYIGQTLTSVRIDPLTIRGEVSVSAIYEIDYIYIGSAEGAPSAQNDSELYFDFNNDAAAMSRYNGIVYGGRNFDRSENAYWATASNGNAKNYSIDNEAGTLNASVDAVADDNGVYDVWVETTSAHGCYPWSSEKHYAYYPLNYVPTNADYVQVRFKLNGCEAVSDKTATVSAVYDYIKDGKNAAEGDMYADINMDAEGFQTVTIPVTDTFKNADVIKSLALRFNNILSSSDGTVVIDYIYVGAKDVLYFGFDNSAEDQQRYTSKTYGDNNFDTGKWVGRNTSVADLKFDNEAGVLSFVSSDATQDYHYVQTSADGTKTDTPLKYVPNAGDSMQIRFKIENAAVNGEPRITVHYMTDERTLIADSAVTRWTLDESYLDGEYHLVDLPLDVSFTQANFISALRVGFEGIASAENETAKFTIDYIYVGATENMPNQNKLLFDFTCDQEAYDRYATPTYGNTDFDTTTNWHLDKLSNAEVVSGTLTAEIAGVSYIRTAIGGSVLADNCPLNYLPGMDDHFQIRFKIAGSSASETELRLYYYVTEDAEWKFTDIGTYRVNAGYLTADVSLKDTNFTSAQQIQGIQVAFGGVADGQLTVDYIYIGSKSELPVSEQLYFDFGNTAHDVQRYDSKTYGGLNYDDASKLQWKTLTTNLAAGNTAINNEEGTLIATSANDAITSICIDTTMNLTYDLAKAEILQIRLKMANFTSVDAKEAYMKLQFFSESGIIANTEAVNLTAEQIASDEYMTFTVKLSDAVRAAGAANKIRLYFGNVAGDATSAVTIDCIYIGSEETKPLQDYLFFGFDNTLEDRERYSSKTYGNINFDTGYWKYNATRNSKPVYDSVTGTVSTEVVGTSPYLQTVAPSGALSTAPLTYATNAQNNLVQIRMKLENLEPIVEGTNGQIVVHFMTEIGTEVETSTALRYTLSEAELNGEYFVVNLKAEDFMAENATIYALRVTAVSMQPIEGADSKMTIDYIYVGSAETAPTGAVYFVDFVGNDGETVVYHSIVSSDGTVSYNGALPEKESDDTCHYTFAGWQSAEGTIIDLESYQFTQDAKLYPHFEEEKHMLVFTTSTDDSGMAIKMHICSACAYNIISDHKWDEGEITSSSTCTSDGVKLYTCTLCAETKVEAIGASGHTIVVDAAVAATCTTEGKSEGSHCSVCNAIIVEQQIIPAIGHSYNEGVITTEATCTTDGVKTYTCANCNGTETEIIEAAGHSIVWIEKKEPTCTQDGYIEHYLCENCNKSYADAELSYELPEEYLILAATGHHLVYKAEKASTCAEVGYIEHYQCSGCGKYYTDENMTYEIPESYVLIEKLAHTEVTDAALAATCTTDGKSEGSHCSVCGTVIKAQETIPATGHTEEIDAAVAPTCTVAGKTQGVHCSVCGVVLTAQETIPSLGHSFTFTNNGNNHTIGCKNCSYNVVADHTYFSGECLCGAKEVTKPTYVLDNNLSAIMNISVGAEMQVIYTIMASKISAFENFNLTVNKAVSGDSPVSTVFGFEEGMQELTAIKNAAGATIAYQAVYTGINAKEMGDIFSSIVYATAADGSIHYSKPNNSSIKQYLMTKIEDVSSCNELRTMAVDMLNYGAAAQIRLNYNVNNLVNADLTDAQKAYGTQQIVSATNSITNTGSGKTIIGNVSLQSKVMLYLSTVYTPTNPENVFYFVIDASSGKTLAKLSVTVLNNGKVCQAVYDKVGAKQMRENVRIMLCEGSTVVSQALTWSIESYVAQVRANTNATQAEIDMANAMLAYGDSVAAYMEVSGQ